MLVGEQNENGIENPQMQRKQIEIEAQAARPSTPMYVLDWAQAQW